MTGHLAAIAIGVLLGLELNILLARWHKRTMKRLRDDFRARFGEELDV